MRQQQLEQDLQKILWRIDHNAINGMERSKQAQPPKIKYKVRLKQSAMEQTIKGR